MYSSYKIFCSPISISETLVSVERESSSNQLFSFSSFTMSLIIHKNLNFLFNRLAILFKHLIVLFKHLTVLFKRLIVLFKHLIIFPKYLDISFNNVIINQ